MLKKRLGLNERHNYGWFKNNSHKHRAQRFTQVYLSEIRENDGFIENLKLLPEAAAIALEHGYESIAEDLKKEKLRLADLDNRKKLVKRFNCSDQLADDSLSEGSTDFLNDSDSGDLGVPDSSHLEFEVEGSIHSDGQNDDGADESSVDDLDLTRG